jgi:hypothetical protein
MIQYYVLTYQGTDGKVIYWTYGSPGRFTENKKDARAYARYQAAEQAIRKIQLKRPEMLKENFKVEPMDK